MTFDGLADAIGMLEPHETLGSMYMYAEVDGEGQVTRVWMV